MAVANRWLRSGPHGEAVLDLVASDGLAAGFATVVLVLSPDTGPAIRYHVEHTWPGAVDVRLALQPEPRGTVDAVLSAAEFVGDTPYGVCNADDVYGVAGCTLLARHLAGRRWRQRLGRLPPGRRLIGFSPVTRGICRVGQIRPAPRSRRATPGAGARPRAGSSPGTGWSRLLCPADARVSMNLWGFTAEFHKVLQAAMDAAVDASEEKEVLLPEVVAQSLGTSAFSVLPAEGRCVGCDPPRRPRPRAGRNEPPDRRRRTAGPALVLAAG